VFKILGTTSCVQNLHLGGLCSLAFGTSQTPKCCMIKCNVHRSPKSSITTVYVFSSALLLGAKHRKAVKSRPMSPFPKTLASNNGCLLLFSSVSLRPISTKNVVGSKPMCPLLKNLQSIQPMSFSLPLDTSLRPESS
jgi:hypothetical protein